MEIEKLLQINKEWEHDFKASLLENVVYDFDSIYDFLDVLLHDWLPIWKEDNTESAELYSEYEKRIENLDKQKLCEEYDVLIKLLHA